MTWVKLDDQFFMRPVMLGVGFVGRDLYLEALGYVSRERGPIGPFVPEWFVRETAGRRTGHVAFELERAGLWERTLGGWWVVPNGLWELGHGRSPSDGPIVHRPAIPVALRAAVYARDGYRCVTCSSDDDLSLDHIWPWSKGGRDIAENLQTMCRPCNSSKGARV